MRLFFAAEISADARRSIANYLAKLRQSRAFDYMRWVPEENLHVTLRFVGEVAAPASATIVREVEAELAAAQPFTAAVGNAGIFPLHGAPRVFWVGLTRGAEEMCALAGAIDRALARRGLTPESREFKPHITAGRVKRGARAERALSRDLFQFAGPEFDVDCVTLFESILNPKDGRQGGGAPRYVPVAKVLFDAVR